MATKVWTDATMIFLFSGSNAGPDWQPTATDAWDLAGSMNGSTGLVTCTTPAAPTIRQLISPVALLADDATVPSVITMTAVRFQFLWTIVTLGPSGPTEIGDAETMTSVPDGGDAGTFDVTEDPSVYFGGTDRATLFSSPVLWTFNSTGASAQQSVAIVDFTVTVTYTTPGSVLSVTPATGSVNGGQAVTIRGSGFATATGVEFGGTAVTSFVIVNDTTITAVTPAHVSGLVDVEVLSVETGEDLYTFVITTPKLPPMPTRTPIRQGSGRG